MQLRALETLVEIERSGSFAVAAARRNMTLSAVSMQMKALERELGATLFDRAFRPPRLTPSGRDVAARAREIAQRADALRLACAPTDHLAGCYRVGFVPTASVRVLPTMLANARALGPAVSFELVTGLSDWLEAKVATGELDFAVVTETPGSVRGLQTRCLLEEPLAFAAPPTPATASPRELTEAIPFLLFTPRSGVGKLIAQHMAAEVGPRRHELVFDSVEAIMECVRLGLGFTLLPRPDIVRTADRQTRILPVDPPGLTRRLVLAFAGAHNAAQAERIAALMTGSA